MRRPARYDRSKLRYPTDLTDDEWRLVEPLIPPGKTGGGRRTVILRKVLKTLIAGGGYQGPQFADALAKILPHLDVEIVKRSDRVTGFVVLPKRWIVEHSIAGFNRCRRLAKDWENVNRKALAFSRLASIRFMLRKLCNPS